MVGGRRYELMSPFLKASAWQCVSISTPRQQSVDMMASEKLTRGEKVSLMI